MNYNNPIELNRYGYTANNPINASDPSGLFLADYALNAFSKLEAARGFVAIGMATGAIYGYVSASLCGGNVAWGIASGAVMGGVSAIGMTLAPAFMAAAGVTASVIGTGMAFNDMAQQGWNACNVMQAFTSIIGIAGGVYGGMSGGSGFGPSLAWAGNNGYVYTMASTVQGSNTAGTISILSLMMSVDGDGNAENDGGSDEFLENIGTLPPATARKIQSMVDDTGEDLYVVGGYARGDPPPRKDIDYGAYAGSAWEKYVELFAYSKLPEAQHPPFKFSDSFPAGAHGTPYIWFRPGQNPIWFLGW